MSMFATWAVTKAHRKMKERLAQTEAAKAEPVVEKKEEPKVEKSEVTPEKVEVKKSEPKPESKKQKTMRDA